MKRSYLKTELMSKNEVDEINHESQIELLQEEIILEKSLRADL